MMNWELIAILTIGGSLALIIGLRMCRSGKGETSSAPEQTAAKKAICRPQRAGHDFEGQEWRDLEIERRHPGSDWVYLPNFDKDNECKLVYISYLGHREAAKPLIERVVEKQEYSLALEREPTNEHDPHAIQVVDKTNDTGSIIGYLPKAVSAVFAERYDTEMPISVMVKRAIMAPDGEVYLRLAPLIPKKALRKQYERSKA